MDSLFLELQNIHKTYISEGEEIKVLQGVNLKIQKGTIVSIEGVSGSGKSTLLNIIGFIDKPTNGELYLKNQKIDYQDQNLLDSLRAGKIGFIFQHYYLLPDFTVWENVIIPLKISNKFNKENKEKAQELLEAMGLSHRLNHYPSQISGGEMARTAFARALVGSKELILADEPTGNLDSLNSKKMIELLWQIHSQYQFTMILVTHDQNLASQVLHRYRLEEGKLISYNKWLEEIKK